MSLSNQPPAPLSEYSPLCKAKSTDGGFSEAFHCMEMQKDFGKAEFPWQRTEGKLNAIGLNVNTGVQLKDGLVKGTGFTDEDKLCFFEGKLDKELKASPKDQREIEVSGKLYSAAPGHLENWALISETAPSSANGSLGLASFPSGPAASTRPPGQLGQNEGVTDQEKAAAGKKAAAEETTCQQAQPGTALPGSDPGRGAKDPEISVWNPHFSPLLPSGVRCPEVAEKKDGAPAYSVIGVVNDSYVQCGFAPSPAVPQLGPPTTTVELAQDDFRSGSFTSPHGAAEEERLLAETEEKLGSIEEVGLLNRGAHQRKAMRRAMSECSHLSVPPALNLADKYPEPAAAAREDLAASLVSPSGSISQSTSPMTRKPSAPMKRSATVSEEQTSGHSPPLGSAQNNNAEPPSLVVKEPPSSPMEEPSAKKRDEWGAAGSNAVKKEPASAGQNHSKLEQIPELSGHSKGCRVEEEEATTDGRRSEKSNVAHKPGSPRGSPLREMEPGTAVSAVPERKGIEVSDARSAPSSQQGDRPRDGMLLNFLSSGSSRRWLRRPRN